MVDIVRFKEIGKTEKMLKECPFCGKRPRILTQEYGYTVDCSDCSVVMRIVTRHLLQVVDNWNYRIKDDSNI